MRGLAGLRKARKVIRPDLYGSTAANTAGKQS